jgi:hypothetical protein
VVEIQDRVDLVADRSGEMEEHEIEALKRANEDTNIRRQGKGEKKEEKNAEELGT